MRLSLTFWHDYFYYIVSAILFLDCVAPKLQLLDGSRDSNIFFCVTILVMNCSFFSKFVHDSMRFLFDVFSDTRLLARKNSSGFA